MREPTLDGSFPIDIASDPAETRAVQELIESELRRHQYNERDIFGVKLALEEALINAIKHGNQLDRAKRVRIQFRVSPERFDIQIADEGQGFIPEDVPDPMAPENMERPTGRGLMLIRYYMTEVHFHTPGNRITMSKVRSVNGSAHGLTNQFSKRSGHRAVRQ
jgi:serine/threonine-protein kinase RsbW